MIDKKAFKFLKKDPKFAKIIMQVGDYNVKITKNRYQSLVESIISQQLSGSAANSIMRKISTQSDEQVIEVLTDVKGIGRWTAEMFLIFSLGRLDILPVGDLGLKKGIQTMYSLKELPEKEQIEQLAESWKPYRTVATWYLWKSLEKFDTIG